MDFGFLSSLVLIRWPCIGFLSVRPDVFRRLPSDSASQRTPLPLAVTFPLSGRFRDFHPLDYVRAGRTTKKATNSHLLVAFIFLTLPQKRLQGLSWKTTCHFEALGFHTPLADCILWPVQENKKDESSVRFRILLSGEGEAAVLSNEGAGVFCKCLDTNLL